MAYRLRKPPGDESLPLPLTAEVAPASPSSSPPPQPPALDSIEPDPERRAAVVAAFAGFFLDLEPLLGDRWLGAWDRLKAMAPPLASAIDDAEAAADRVALDYMHGRATWANFESALTQYARVWQAAAGALSVSDARADEHRCAECGRTDFVAGVRDDEGALRCSRCLAGVRSGK